MTSLWRHYDVSCSAGYVYGIFCSCLFLCVFAYPYRPQSGHIRPCCISPIRPYPPGKTAVFPEFSIFFQIRTNKKIITAHRGPIYQIKAHEKPYPMQKKSLSFDKEVWLGRPLNLDIIPKFWRHFKEILENHGEIPHPGWNSVGSKGLRIDNGGLECMCTWFCVFSDILSIH